MIAIPAGILVIVVHEPVNFSCGIDGMRGHCISITKKDPIQSGYFLFVNKRKNQARVIWYDGQGFSLCSKRLSSGIFSNWPRKTDGIFSTIEYFQAQGILSSFLCQKNVKKRRRSGLLCSSGVLGSSGETVNLFYTHNSFVSRFLLNRISMKNIIVFSVLFGQIAS